MGRKKNIQINEMGHTESLIKRFWKGIDKQGENDCWEWKYSLTKRGGYGQLTNGRNNLVKTHRLSYEIHHGEIKKGYMICHKCNNPKCCNPKHLYLGTASDNWHDTIRSGRNYILPPLKSDQVHTAKINYEIARIIRESKDSGPLLSKKYDISRTMISRIKRNLSWKENTI